MWNKKSESYLENLTWDFGSVFVFSAFKCLRYNLATEKYNEAKLLGIYPENFGL